MNKDGDILGSRRRVEASQPGSSGTLTASSLPGSSSDVGGTIGSTRHPPGASPLKRQRSTGGGPARAESEVSQLAASSHQVACALVSSADGIGRLVITYVTAVEKRYHMVGHWAMRLYMI